MSVEPAPYDFRSPDRLSRQREQALQVVVETLARRVSTVLSSSLRTIVPARVVSLGQRTYGEYLESVPRPSVLGALAVEGLPGGGHLQLALGDVMGFLDRMLGGTGTGEQPERPLTEIESGLAEMLLGQIVGEIPFAFTVIGDLPVALTGLESTVRFHQVARATDPVVTVELELGVFERPVALTACLTLSTLTPLLTTLDKMADDDGAGERAAQTRRVVTERLGHVEVDVRVAFREVTLTSAEVFALSVGDVVPLRHRTEEPLVVSTGAVRVARATPGSHGRRLAVQIVP
ncbi:flagellar motor switch protein FliM [Phycicoccus sp.]|uniref:flagellar motor switch protein FliM n=1 Tax=Phycicoccus sp. TaxID=1902410 RepID=UPI002B9DA90B|nr:flagellar motor switch protein FliM [Phycicoccus sp.]HMM96136.1 flagellar motor switch protein FliM [Phycicoccus sp.]